MVQCVADSMSACVVEVVLFLEPKESTNLRFMSIDQVGMSLREDDQVLVMSASVIVENNVATNDMSVVCEFPDIFREDICDFPPKREVDFAIDLVPGTRPVSMTPYRMLALELGELKK